jgi:uncharacterized membrane protein
MPEPPPHLATSSKGELQSGPVGPGLVTPLAVSPPEIDKAKWIHLASILAPLTAPIVGYAIGGKSTFVRAHALDCAMDLLRWKLILFVVRIGLLINAVVRIATAIGNEEQLDFKAIIARALIGLLILGTFEVWNIVQAILSAKKASKGKWPRRNVFHKWFRLSFGE